LPFEDSVLTKLLFSTRPIARAAKVQSSGEIAK
jgi:hypothetical protein